MKTRHRLCSLISSFITQNTFKDLELHTVPKINRLFLLRWWLSYDFECTSHYNIINHQKVDASPNTTCAYMDLCLCLPGHCQRPDESCVTLWVLRVKEHNNPLLATNKNYPPHLSCIWGPITGELKGKTPQKGMKETEVWGQRPEGTWWSYRVCLLCQGRAGWESLGSLIAMGLQGTKGLIMEMTF